MSMESLAATRDLLKTSLERSKAVGMELDRMSLRLEQIKKGSSSLQPFADMKYTSPALKHHINSAARPAEAVFKILSTILQIEKLLLETTSCSSLSSYLYLIDHLEQALKFLSNNCGLAIQWLQGTMELLEDNGVSNNMYMLNAKKSLSILQELQAADKRSCLDGGVLNFAFNHLQVEFKRLLTEGSVPCASDSLSTTLAEHTIEKLRGIIKRLNLSNRLEKCTAIYVASRSSNAKASFCSFDLGYLNSPHLKLDDEEYIESILQSWSKHLEYAINHVFEHEFNLCKEVFVDMGNDISTSCFAKIASGAGIIAFLQFGKKVAEGKKSPSKLLNLLKIFAALDRLRLHFTRLFRGEACTDIQTLTRDLVKNVVNGAWEIFWELSFQVELQRRSEPPSDGSVPLLVSFVTAYCNLLLEDTYGPTMIQILVIHQSWNHKKYQEGLFTNQIYSIVKEVNLNLDEWSKAYQDRTLSYLFMMNNHHHFCKLKGTKLGDMMGDSWLRAHEQYRDHYAALYFKESWGKLSDLMTQDSLTSCSETEESSRDLMKRKLKAFNDAFEDIHKEQSNWSIPDETLRERTCRLLIRAIVPVYESYLEANQNTTISRDLGSNQHIKHSITGLGDMLGSLFQPKLRKVIDSDKHNTVNAASYQSKIANLMANQICLTAA